MPDVSVKMSPDELKLLVDTEIRKSIALALGENAEGLIKAVVAAAMTAKPDSYSRETIFQKRINEMIRDAATEEFKAWLDRNKKVIKKAVRERLEAERGALDGVADKVIDALASSFVISVGLRSND